MELSKQLKVIDRKFAYNTGKLPGFSSGLTSSDEHLNNLMLWMNNLQQYNSGNKNVDGAVDTSILPTRGNFDTAGMSAAGQLASRKDIPHLSTEIKKIAKGINIDNIQTTVSALPGFVESMYGAATDHSSKNEYLALYRPIQANIAGIGYQKMTNAKNGKLPGCAGGAVGNIAGATASGAAIGSVAGPWGAAIGGAVGLVGSTIGEIFSARKDRENREAASRYMRNVNSSNEGGALSLAMLIANAKQYGNQYDQSLWGHANGKIPGFSGGTVENLDTNGFTQLPKILHTINGIEVGKANAKVEPDEGVSKVLPDGSVQFNRYSDGKIRNKRPGDILYTYTTPDETIWTNNKDPYTGMRFSDEAELRVKAGLPLDDLQFRMAEQLASKKNGKITKAKCGKLPGHAEGWLGNGIPAMLGSIAGLGQYIQAKNSKPYYPSTYAANPYETEALTTLAGLRINPFPITQQLRNAEARTKNAIDSAGGLSGGQRTAARLAALNTTQGNISKLLSDILQQNNAYRANYAQAAINAGQASRQARMSANQWDLDYYSKAHAARNRGIQTGIANMLAQIQQYQSNEFKRRQLNDAMDLYRDDMDLRKKYMNWMQNHSGLNISQNADPIKNPSSQYWNQLLPSEKWLALYNRGIIG